MDIILSLAIVAALSLAGATAAGVKATSPDAGSGRKVELWIFAGALIVFALVTAAGAYWFWRFTVEFTF